MYLFILKLSKINKIKIRPNYHYPLIRDPQDFTYTIEAANKNIYPSINSYHSAEINLPYSYNYRSGITKIDRHYPDDILSHTFPLKKCLLEKIQSEHHTYKRYG